MNILFCSNNAVSPQKGGIERVIHTIVINNRGRFVPYSQYYNEIPDHFERTPFNKTINYKPGIDKLDLLSTFINSNNIDICVIYRAISDSIPLRNDLIKCCKAIIILVHSVSPGRESLFLEPDFHNINSLRKCFGTVKTYWRQYRYGKWISSMYKKAACELNAIVVMSSKHKEGFMKYGRITDGSKIHIIHNPLSYNDFFDINKYDVFKKKEVLIVSRLYEKEKHILQSLKIWKFIEKDSELGDWHLTIVGHGSSEQDYKDYVKKMGLNRVSFEGKQEPQSYYQRASILISTSPAESWGNIFTEAQQNACVPMSFNNLIAIPIIITDMYNGITVQKGCLRKFVCKLTYLMKDYALRKKLAEGGEKFTTVFTGHN